jgi:hypothetical protein
MLNMRDFLDHWPRQATVGSSFDEPHEEAGCLLRLIAGVGSQLGLFDDLAAHGPSSSKELAARMQLNERYVYEWLEVMTAAGFLEYYSQSGRFALP